MYNTNSPAGIPRFRSGSLSLELMLFLLAFRKRSYHAFQGRQCGEKGEDDDEHDDAAQNGDENNPPCRRTLLALAIVQCEER